MSLFPKKVEYPFNSVLFSSHNLLQSSSPAAAVIQPMRLNAYCARVRVHVTE